MRLFIHPTIQNYRTNTKPLSSFVNSFLRLVTDYKILLSHNLLPNLTINICIFVPNICKIVKLTMVCKPRIGLTRFHRFSVKRELKKTLKCHITYMQSRDTWSHESNTNLSRNHCSYLNTNQSHGSHDVSLHQETRDLPIVSHSHGREKL